MEELILQPQQEAVMVTERIRANGKIAVNAVCNIGKDLRYMKIEELYKHIGYDTFEDYAEKEFDLKRRQAYQYISVYERLGESFVQSNAQLGISKLALLAQVDTEDRIEIIENNDVSHMTVNEIRRLVDKCKQYGEQLSMLETENEELKKQSPKELEERMSDLEKANKRLMEKIDEAEASAAASRKSEAAACGKLSILRTDFEMLQEKAAQQEKKIEDLENRPVEVAVKEVPDTKVIEKKDKIIEKLRKQYNDLSAERAQEIQDLKKDYEKKLEEMQRSSADTSTTSDKTSFKSFYTSAYKEINGLLEFVKESDTADKQTYIPTIEKLLYAVSDALDKMKAGAS
ncbi:MAG: DUF3102 domain-containing protein [Ruminococcus sp.]|nr:DUF3102 domain-containing protein [Ruminococcus sp.]